MWVGHEHVVDALRELSDERLQRLLWLSDGTGGADVSSLVECIERLYTDSGLGEALRSGSVYGLDVDADLRLLARELDRIDGQLDPATLLADPVMIHVRSSAAALLGRLPG